MPRHASITWPGVGTGGCTQTDTTVRFLRARVSGVADLVVLARSLAADNATALDRCTRTPPTEKAATR